MGHSKKKSASGNLARLRQALRKATHGDEAAGVEALLAGFPLKADARSAIQSVSKTIVKASRARSADRGTLDAFLQEFGLSNQEGVALMCLAEALLRIPDTDTQDRLIAEKILAGDWANHKGRSDKLFVNASVWALMLTGSVISLDKGARDEPGKWVKSLVTRLGEPVIREATMQAMRIMGRQFVFGHSIKNAMKRKTRQSETFSLFSFDMLGEGARTRMAAEHYQALYLTAIDVVGKDGANIKGDHRERSSISIKLSALHPRYETVKNNRVMTELLPRVKELALAAKSYDMGLTIDAEEAARLDISLDILEALARDKDLAGWQGLGLALQAYQKRALVLIDWLGELARDTNRQFPVRLVKGAYWDTEIKYAQEMGYADYPVWTRKATTDICYLSCAHKLLALGKAFYPQFATHNAHTIAAVSSMATHVKCPDYEFQKLHGMGDLLYQAAIANISHMPRIRTYAPVGVHKDLLPYLVRRLLENGANSSFINRFMDANVPVDEIIKDPYEHVLAFRSKRHARIPTPPRLYDDRKNSSGIDLANPAETEALMSDLANLSDKIYQAPSLVSGKAVGGEKSAVTSPADQKLVVGYEQHASDPDIERALAAALDAQPGWNEAGGEARAVILEKLGDMIEEDRITYIDLLVREAGKTIADAISEIREAADYCRFYASEARSKFKTPLFLKGPTGESNELSLHGRGIFICISPWNFPLAIFTGQVMAAIAAGNSVIAKPAGQTPLIAAHLVGQAHRAGIPADVLHLLLGPGSKLGAKLVSDERIAGVAVTGSTWTAKLINKTLAARTGPIVPLIAETGGQNVMIVDSSALLEQVSDDVMTSAFSSAGQRCSALRVLYVHDSIADDLILMLKGAIEERQCGDPGDLATDTGPVIDAGALKELQEHLEFLAKSGTLIGKSTPPENDGTGSYLVPHIFEIPSLDLLEDEVFGPILHLIRYGTGEEDHILRQICATGYGLTFGVHSRIEGRWDEFFKATRIGNTYVNRNMIGAVVGVQPFGGQGQSGTGPKAGGPHYLYRFATEKVLTINLAAIGGNTDLFRLEEGRVTEDESD